MSACCALFRENFFIVLIIFTVYQLVIFATMIEDRRFRKNLSCGMMSAVCCGHWMVHPLLVAYHQEREVTIEITNITWLAHRFFLKRTWYEHVHRYFFVWIIIFSWKLLPMLSTALCSAVLLDRLYTSIYKRVTKKRHARIKHFLVSVSLYKIVFVLKMLILFNRYFCPSWQVSCLCVCDMKLLLIFDHAEPIRGNEETSASPAHFQSEHNKINW